MRGHDVAGRERCGEGGAVGAHAVEPLRVAVVGDGVALAGERRDHRALERRQTVDVSSQERIERLVMQRHSEVVKDASDGLRACGKNGLHTPGPKFSG